MQVVHDAGVENATYNGITKSYPVNAFCNQQHELIVTMVTVLLGIPMGRYTRARHGTGLAKMTALERAYEHIEVNETQ